MQLSEYPERFSSKVAVDESSGCWNWTAAKNEHGYGRYQTGVKTGVKLAHRLSFEMATGPIPPGLIACHKCDNPSCVNPTHLFLGDRDDNAKDCAKKGRTRGQGRVPLTPEAVRTIRSSELPYKELGETYGRTISAIEKIRAGQSYAWLV